MSLVLFYNVENKKIKKENLALSRCVQTFDWYSKLRTKPMNRLQFILKKIFYY